MPQIFISRQHWFTLAYMTHHEQNSGSGRLVVLFLEGWFSAPKHQHQSRLKPDTKLTLTLMLQIEDHSQRPPTSAP